MPQATNAQTLAVPPPEKPYSVSYSKMSLFRRCRQQFHWKYINKLFPPSSMGQQRGTSGHAALAIWHVDYDEDKARQAAWDSWSNAGFADGEDWNQLDTALLRYFEWSRANDTFVLQVAEQKFEIEYTISVRPDPQDYGMVIDVPVIFTGFMDGIVQEGKQTWILENKFLKRMDNTDQSLDQQASSYMLAAHLLNYDVNGVIYNKIRIGDGKTAEKEPVVRTKMFRNKRGLSRIQDEMLIQIAEMYQYEKGGGVPYRNPTKDCGWDCSFHQGCLSMQDDGQEPTDILHQIVNIRSTDSE